VDGSQQYSTAEMERMMKIQEVLLRAMAKKITWWQAAEIIGVTDQRGQESDGGSEEGRELYFPGF
jgi:hypothetical protein